MNKVFLERIIGFFFITLFFINLVSAFGVATLYSENYPLRVKPGEVKETFFLLMNTAEGDSDISIKSELVKGGEIAKLIEGPKDYDLPFGKEVEVPVVIEIPKNIPVGTKYKVSAMFRPLPKDSVGEGNVQFIVNIGKSFPIEIVGSDDKKKGGSTITLENEPEELLEKSAPSSSKNKFIWLVAVIFFLVGIIVMMLVIILVLKGRSKTELQPMPYMNNYNTGAYNGNGYSRN